MLSIRIPGGDFKGAMTFRFSHHATASGLRAKAGSTSEIVRWQRAFSLSPEAQGLCVALAGAIKCGPVVLPGLQGKGPCGKEAVTLWSGLVTLALQSNSPPAATEPD